MVLLNFQSYSLVTLQYKFGESISDDTVLFDFYVSYDKDETIIARTVIRVELSSRRETVS